MKTLISKISICCLVLCMLLACAVPAFAEDGYTKPTLQVVSTAAKAGETVDVAIVMHENPGIICMKLEVNYDSDVLTLTKVTDGGILGANMHPTKPDELKKNPYPLTWANDLAEDNFKDDGQLVLLTFAVKEGAAVGEYPIVIEVEKKGDIYDYDFNDISFDLVDGSVTVCTHESMTEVAAKEAGCETTGNNKYFTCDSCGTVFKADGSTKSTLEDETLPALGHSYNSVVIEPSCGYQGYTTYTCSVCGYSYEDDYTEPTGEHDYECYYEQAPTCGNPGAYFYQCTVCGDAYEEYPPAAGEHDYECFHEQPPTCVDAGTNYYQCTVCGATYDEYTEALGHSYNSVVTEPTCTKKGYTTYTCSVCGDTYEDDYTEPTGEHDYECYVVQAPTCVDTGAYYYQCTVCGDDYEEYPEALGHSYNSVVTAPTCTEKGYTNYTCSVCGDTYDDDFTEPTGEHDYECYHEQAPTCSNAGAYYYQCATCGATYEEHPEALGHSYNSVVTAPTCTEKGYTNYTCSVCGDTYDDDFTEPTGEHDYECYHEQAPTCIAGAYYYQCTVCGDTYEEYPPAVDEHDYECYVVQAPTCVDTGVYYYQCTVCGDDYEEYPEALGHNMQETAAKVEATCEKDGKEAILTCANGCGKTEGGAVIPANGHTEGETKIENVTDDSYDEVTYCAVCDKEIKRETVEVTTAGSVNAGLKAGNIGDVIEMSVWIDGVKVNDVRGYKSFLIQMDYDPTALEYVGYTGDVTVDANTSGEIIVSFESATLVELGATDKSYSVSFKILSGYGDYPVNITVLELFGDKGVSIHPEVHNGRVSVACYHNGGTRTETENKVEATCMEAGSYDEVVYCTICNAEVSRNEIPVSALGHNMQETTAEVKATCEATGKTAVYTCSNGCGKTEGGEVIPATDHNMQKTADEVAATCEATGKTAVYTCANGCGKTEGGDKIDALGHNEVVDPEVKPTCVAEGKTEGKHCDRCDTILEPQETVAPLGHTEVIDEAMDATCKTTGLTEGKHCSVCGDVLVAQIETEKLPHTEEIVPAVPATCTTPGKTEGVKCSVCGEVLTAQEETDALGHTEEIVPAVPATCTTTGLTEGVKCSVCNTTLTAQEVIEALGHTEETLAGYPATCTEDGLTDGKKCSVCGTVTVEQTVIPAAGHAWVGGVCTECTMECEHSYDIESGECTICGGDCDHEYATVVTPPSCTAQGYTTNTCSICGNSFKNNFQDALGHTMQEATCTAPKTCSTCGATEGEANGHNYVAVVTPPSCTAQGYTTYTCAACGDSYKSDYQDALGHTEDAPKEENRVEPGCTEAGHYDKVVYCSVCGTELSKEPVAIPATGHSYDAVVTNPTCADQGYTTYTCTKCGDNYKSDYENALGHTEVIDEAKDATCTEGGLTEGKHCSVCEKVLVEQSATSPLGHTEGEPMEEDGYLVVYCTVCHTKLSSEAVTLWGDADQNGVVDQHDASLIFEYFMNDGVVNADTFNVDRADVDCSGVIDQHDATLVFEFFLEVIDKLPVEK